MPINPAVSVIMPLHNSAPFMGEGIGSVLGQSFRDLELVLVDDASDDETLELARRHAAADRRVQVLSLPINSGAAVARNAGLAAVRGRHVAFLDSDDVWETDKLAHQLKAMKERNAVFSYTDYVVVDPAGAPVRTVMAPDRLSYRGLLKNTAIGCSTVILDRQGVGEIAFPSIRKRQDLALWLSILRRVEFAHRCGPVLTRYRHRPGSISRNKFSAAAHTWRVYREHEQMSLGSSAYYFLRYALAAVGKRL